MRYLFIVQGEGRGHMTQAISLRNILVKHGQEVVHVLVGISKRREVPKFFFDKIGAPVEIFESPNLVTDRRNVKIKIFSTFTNNVVRFCSYLKSLKYIDSVVKNTKPDVVVNFYELLFGIYFRFYNPNVKHVCIGHHYLLKHPDFVFPLGWKRDKVLMTIYTNIVSFGASKCLALSFRKMRDLPEKNIVVAPPLLRHEVAQLKTSNEGFILGYMLNAGYATQIEEWHNNNSQVKVHFFWDKKDAPEHLQVSPTLAFHSLNDVKFLEYMSRCSGYATTGGFESLCEAMYMGKPMMIVPTEGHFEQAANAVDCKLAGGGVINSKFDLTVLVEYIPNHKDITAEFRAWADQSESVFVRELTKF